MVNITLQQRVAASRQAVGRAVPAAQPAGIPWPQRANNAVAPGGWFGGWLGVAPYWNREREGGRRMGVVDGSEAQPGEIGEWHIFDATVTAPVGANSQQLLLGPLSAGDWDLLCWGYVGGYMIGFNFFLTSPIPDGIFGDLGAEFFGDATGPQEAITLIGRPGRALTTAPVNFIFTLLTSTPTAQNVQLSLTARRMR